ncbi:MAG: molybdopterin-synthase adenylyltransferase MoeB [Verrucomicrobiae bacterium]|nr:molybdopterin-synthase adenylyltransferase MoeB [Verrucomicrobiae bacterium]
MKPYLEHDPAKLAAVTLSNEEIARYSRHLIMPEVTIEGQRKIKNSSVLCVGTGGLGSPILLYLAAAGVGRIGIMDYDVVDYSNLQRQIIHDTSKIGKTKVQSAKERIHEINPYVQVETHECGLTSDNAMDIIKNYDVVVDGTDNFPTRYLTNDACVLLDKPNIYGSIFRFDGMVSVFWGKHGPCYRCMFPEPPPAGSVPSCAEGGVLGVLPGVIGVIQATEIIKIIAGIGDPLIGRLLIYNALSMKFREVKIRKDPECPICGPNPTIRELIDYKQFCGVQEYSEDEIVAGIPEVTVKELKAKMDKGDKFVLLDVREPHEWAICEIPGSTRVPLPDLAARLHEFDSADEFYVYCKNGPRSAKAIEILNRAGYKKAWNIHLGVWAWADKIDKSMPKY